MEGIAKAKAKGVYKGKKPTVDRQVIKDMYDQGIGATAICRKLNIGRTSVYRAIR